MMQLREGTLGIHSVEQVLQQRPESVQQLIMVENSGNRKLESIAERAKELSIPVEFMPRAEMDARYPANHQGVAAVLEGSRPKLSEKALLARLKEKDSVLLLVLDCITDPHNLGACLRSADAAGVDAVVVPKDKSAQLNETVAKVASGAAETVDLVAVTNLARFLNSIQELGIWVVGTDDAAETSLYSQDLKGSIAIVMGSEGDGLRRLTREQCDFLVSIPMAGELSSLNVSVAAGIALFEAVRQRSE